MNYFRLKNLLTISLTLVTLAMFTTSCEKDTINPDFDLKNDKTIIEKEHAENVNTNASKNCIPSAPSADYIDYILRDFLIVKTEAFLDKPGNVRATNVKKRWGTIVRHVNRNLCTSFRDETEMNWENGNSSQIVFSNDCSTQAITALYILQLRLELYLMGLDDPTAQEKLLLKNAFIFYIEKLNQCFGASFDTDDYEAQLSFLD